MSNLRTNRIEPGSRVDAYRNLNLIRQGITGWSIRQAGTVRRHAAAVLILDIRPKHATEAQALRLKSHAREVCAWIKGDYSTSWLNGDDAPDVDLILAPGYRPLLVDPKHGDGKFRRWCDQCDGRGCFGDEGEEECEACEGQGGVVVDGLRPDQQVGLDVYLDADGRAWIGRALTPNVRGVLNCGDHPDGREDHVWEYDHQSDGLPVERCNKCHEEA